jgi:hypothetical protein
MPAAAAAGNLIAINTLRGGMNDTDPAHLLPEDQCVLAMNVEWFYSSLGERRLGMDLVAIDGSDLDTETQTVHLSEWFPTNDARASDVWMITATPNISAKMAYRDTSLAWHPVTPIDAIIPNEPAIWNINAQPLNAKDFFAYQSAVDRLHVWDGTQMRRAGLPQPNPVTAVDEGSGSTYTTVRYFRVRLVNKTGSTVNLRSEPSTELTFTPSGTGAGATISMPVPPANESATDWEIEASLDNGNYYLIQTQPLALTSYTDTTQDDAFYSDQGPLSEAVGAYLLPQSGKYLLVDGDRLIIVSHFTDPALQSRVSWTPPHTDPGVGNDERVPIVTTGGLPIASYKDLDNYDGGQITGVSRTANGTFFVFKFSAIYQFQRTQDDTNAYNVFQLTSNNGPRGAVEGSVVPGIDEYGQGCIYFLDPFIGPSRVGNMGVERIEGLRTTWKRVNTLATTISARGIYYPDKQQVWWWVAIDGNNTPNLLIKLQVSECRSESGRASRGFSLADGFISEGMAVSQVSELVILNGVSPQLSRRPFIGFPAPYFLMRGDTGEKDYTTRFHAKIVSRPYLPAGLLNQWESMVGALLAVADTIEPESNASRIQVSIIRDFGLEESTPIRTRLSPKGDETQVIKQFDNLHMAEAYALQFVFSDVP